MSSRLIDNIIDGLPLYLSIIVTCTLLFIIGYCIDHNIKHPQFYCIKLNFNNSIVEYKHIRYYGTNTNRLWFYDKDDVRIDYSGSWIVEKETTPEKE